MSKIPPQRLLAFLYLFKLFNSNHRFVVYLQIFCKYTTNKGELRKEKGDFLCEVSAEAKLVWIMPKRSQKTRNAKH